MSTQEKHRMYLVIFPKNWTETFDVNKDIDNTSYEEINHFMKKQKEKADKEHAKRERRRRNRKTTRRKPVSVAIVKIYSKLTQRKIMDHKRNARSVQMPSIIGLSVF